MRMLVLCLAVMSWPAVAQPGPEDAGVVDDAGVAAVQVPPPAPELGFDGVVGPWGLARRSAGEKFSSTTVALPEGPLRWSWNGFSVALGAQYFARAEARDNQDLNALNGDHALGVDHRARLSLRASARGLVGVLLELQDVRGWGSELNTSTTAADTGLHQGFVDLRATRWLDVRVGRQELSYGEERLVGALDWNQNARAFDGVFVRLEPSGAFTLDAFGMMVKPPQWLTTPSDLRFHNSGTWFAGLVSRARLEKSGLDVYALGLFEDPSSAAAGLSKDQNRVTLGARAFTAWNGLALVGEGAFQTGKVGPKEELLLAGAFAVKATWTFGAVWGAPYLGAELSAASDTFNQLFPTGHAHLGFIDLVGWQNVVAQRGTLGFRPWGAHVWVDVHHFSSWSPQAAWTTATGAVFLPADSGRTAGNRGTEVDVSFTVPLGVPNLALAGCFAVFAPGEAAAAKGSNASTWGFLSLRAQL